MTTPYAPEDLYEHRVLGALDGAPTHDRLVFKVTRALRKADTNRARVYGLRADERRSRALSAGTTSAQSPKLDPRGQRVAFLSSRGNAGTQAQVLRLDGGEARCLTHADAALASLEDWSPDGGQLLLIGDCDWSERAGEGDGQARARSRKAGRDDDSPQVATFLPYKRDGSGAIVGKRAQLLRADVDSGAVHPVVHGDFDVHAARWSPDGTRVAYIRGRSGRQRHRKNLWLCDADGGHAHQRTHSLASVQKLAWSPDGRWSALIASEREGAARAQLWVLDADAKSPPRRVGGEDLELASASGLVWHPDGTRIAVIAMHRGLQPVTIVSLSSDAVRLLTHGLRQAYGLTAWGDRLSYVSTSMRWPDELYSVGWDDGRAPRRHSAFNRRWARTRPQPRVRKRRFTVPDGDDGSECVDAWLLLPAHGSGPYPLLVDIHGGPQSAVLADFAMHTAWYPLLSQGWAVLAPNPVGSSGYGAAFAERIRARWGELDFPQVEAIVGTLQHERFTDTRIAITGKSYGGYLAAWAIGHTSRFKAIVSAPVTNILSHAGTSDSGYYVSPYAMGGEMHEVTDRAHALSPVLHDLRTDTPTLILQGADDGRCPIGQSEELFARLIRSTTVPTELVVYPGGTHGLAESGKPSHRVDYHQRLCDWAHRWVLGQHASTARDRRKGDDAQAA